MDRVTPLPEPVVALVAQRFRVLSEPARIRLLDALRTSGPASVGELAARLGMGQQNTSKHLGVLAGEGLVERTKAGNSALYEISDPTVSRSARWSATPFATALPRCKPRSHLRRL